MSECPCENGKRRLRRRSRSTTTTAALCAQDRAPLSWTNERADTLFVCERERKAADPKARSWASGSEQLNTVCERSTKQEGDPVGEDRIALWAARKVCCAPGYYAASTDFPRSLAIACRSI